MEASAEDRDTRGFISMTTSSPVSRSSANCTLEPPVSTPTARMTVAAASRSVWNSRSESVIAGATQTESPVCTPIGSRFSIEQTTMTLSTRSRMTSSSNSPQPLTDSSTSTCEIGEAATPRATTASSSSAVAAKPPPCPPSVKAGRITSGSRTAPSARSCRASSTVCAIAERAQRRPTLAMQAAKRSRSSAVAMASTEAPISSIPSSSSTPAPSRLMAMLSAVWPPSVGSRASGRSRRSTLDTPSRSSGSMYVRSAQPGSVMIVAGLELTRTVSYPSSRSTRRACTPE